MNREAPQQPRPESSSARQPAPRPAPRMPAPSPYSRRVRLMKILLPLLAVAVIGAIFLAGRDRGDVSAILSAEKIARLSAGLRLETPRFVGRTEAGEPFSLSAAWAEPNSAMPDEILLEDPAGEIRLDEARLLTGRADSGLLLRGENRLTLTGAVVIETSDGYRFETDILEIDTANKAAASPSDVLGLGPNGTIEAGSMRLRQNPETKNAAQIWFENRVRVVFSPEGDPGADGPARATPDRGG